MEHGLQQIVAMHAALLHTTSRGLSWHGRYVKRRTKEEFRTHQHEADVQAVESFLTAAKAELEVVKRQALVYQMYARKHKSIMVRAWLCEWPSSVLHHCKQA